MGHRTSMYCVKLIVIVDDTDIIFINSKMMLTSYDKSVIINIRT